MSASAVTTVGGLLPRELLERIAHADQKLGGLEPTDFDLAPSERTRDAVTRSWNRLTSLWSAFRRAEEALPEAGTAATRLTRERWLLPLLNELGFAGLSPVQSLSIDDGKSYAISHEWSERVPVHLMGWRTPIDRRTPGLPGAAAASPHGLVQEFLNRSDSHLWGIVSNGKVLRLLRDNVTLTRQAYLEFDLAAVFEGESFADFTLLWLCCHRTRFEGDIPQRCLLEQWSKEAATAGTRARDKLRLGVEQAIVCLGNGALGHPANTALRDRLRSGELTAHQMQRQLLRVVYRMLFLLVAESRNLLSAPDATDSARDRYRRFYSMERLRRLARNRRSSSHGDLWQGLLTTMEALDVGNKSPQRTARGALGLTALGSLLWSQREVADLANVRIDNAHLLEAVRNLAYVHDDEAKGLRPVDYQNLGTEELGSVYESLLELHAVADPEDRIFNLGSAAGSERKTTGSYYTPPELISRLLDDALDPVIEEATAKPEPEQALLDLKVLDPACGSGHFLIAAAHRIADALASARDDDTQPSPESARAALREVIGRCLYGIDINPMAVELCKISLWLEGNTPGKPLRFLEHRIVCGNSLLGTTPRLLAEGIPDAAFKPLTGDDKQHVSTLRKANKAERKHRSQSLLELEWSAASAAAHLASAVHRIDVTPDDTANQVAVKETEYARLQASGPAVKAKLVADAWCSAFVAPKTTSDPPITDKTLRAMQARSPEQVVASVWSSRQEAANPGDRLAAVDSIVRLADQYQFTHLHLTFPDVVEVPEDPADATNEHAGWSGGFDVVIGNPPWDQIQYDLRETFATSHPDIAEASTMAKRNRLLDELATSDPGTYMRYVADVRHLDGIKHFFHASGRYPLGSVGRLNTAPLFLELTWNAIAPNGQTGLIVPSGIATDSFTQGFFRSMISRHALLSLYHFENREGIFPAVHYGQKFCLLTLTGSKRPVLQGSFAFFIHDATELGDSETVFRLAPADFSLLNPNTKTCPVFRTRRDADITKAIYQRMDPMVREDNPSSNPWNVTFQLMFMMNTDSHVFRTREELESDGYILKGNHLVRSPVELSTEPDRYLPLYEGKMATFFDHRSADVVKSPTAVHRQNQPRYLSTDEKTSPCRSALPLYWVSQEIVAERMDSNVEWCIGVNNVTSAANSRTVVCTAFPPVAVSETEPLIRTSTSPSLLLSLLNSFVLDYVARQKVGGNHLTLGLLKQLPVLPPDLVQPYAASVDSAVLELSFTAWDMVPFAHDLGYDGSPFCWDEERRALIRAELDGLMFHLYGINRVDVDYIMGTFPIVKRQDEEEHGEFRTRRLLSNSGRGARDRVGGCGRIGGMQGTEKPDRELLDALGLCGALVREGSVYRFLAEHRLRLFGDGLFADLFGGRGRPSVPGSVIAVVMVLQALEGCSDREAVERLRCDVRWKAAAGLGIDDEGFDASVLTLWRQRLRASERPERVFDAVREVAAECGALSKRTRRALDSTVLYDAVATQDTVTMIGAQIRRVRRLAPQAAALVLAHDYDSRAKPVCDWGDPDERAWLIDELVTDARAVLDALDGSELTGEQARAAALLAVVAGQDVEADPKVPGRWRIARRVARGRVISTVDPEARHARKSRSQRSDGYKAHICAEPDTGLITAAELTTADTSDAQVGPRLLQQDPTAPHNTADTDTADTADTDTDTADTDTADTADTDTADTADTDTADTAAVGDVGAEGFVGLVLADSAYASGEALDAFAAAGYDTAIKPIDPKPRITGGFTRDDFTIDTDAQTVTCPAGHTKAVTSGAARFGALCRGCPLRARCTTSAAGRSVTVDAHHHRRQANKTRWAQPATQGAYQQHRPMAERSIAWLTRNKARRVPYRGVAANHLWLTTRAAAVNLVRLTNLGVTHDNGAFTL